MPRLKDVQQVHIVTALASFSTPTEVQADLKSIYGLDVGLDAIMYYDPTTANGSKLAKKWKDLFHETRARFKREVEDIAIANKAFRLRRLDVLARATKSPKLEAELMEQAAKEVGDVYTNRRVHSGTLNIDWSALSDDQLDRIADGADPSEVL